MTQLIIFSHVVFAAAGTVGWYRHGLFFWNVVDVLYYPTAAIGIGLLFASNDVQRDLYQVSERLEEQRAKLSQIMASKPNVQVLKADDLLASSVDTIAAVSRWVEVCSGSPAAAEPRCMAARNLGPPIDAFLKTARAKYPSYEDRLAATCTAGDELLETVRKNEAISSLVADKLLSQYAEATSKKLSPLDYDAVNAEINQFKARATEYVIQIQRLAFREEDKGSKLLLDIRMAEIEYGEFLLRGLLPCIASPRKELGLLTTWMATTRTQEQETARLDAQREDLKQATTSHTWSLWLQLNLWPFFLVGALALKFAKGLAGLRKAMQNAA